MENPSTLSETSSDKPSIGLLLVHGIGAQKSGETTANFVEGFLRAFPDARFDMDNRTLAVEARLIRLYEVYWADLLKDERAKGAFNRELINSVAWFPWLHFRSGGYAPGDYSLFLVLSRTLTLVPVGVVFQLMYQGANFLAGIAQAFSKSAEEPPISSDTLRQSEVEQSFLHRTRSKALASAASARDARTVVDDLLDEYLGDVFTYVDSAGRAFQEGSPFYDTADQIHGRFYKALEQASSDGCSEIQIVAHSLGTVVTHLALSGYNLKPNQQGEPQTEKPISEQLSRLTRLYTIGSPLEKIRFVWPKLITTGLIERVRFINNQAEALSNADLPNAAARLRWDNFYDPFDRVSGKLKRFEHWGGVTNHRLFGLGGPLRSHINYQSSRGFLSVISEGLAGKSVVIRNKLVSKVKNIFLSLGENLFVLIAIPLTLITGLAFVVLVAGGLAFVLGWLIRLLGVSEHTTNIIKDVTMITIAVLFVIGVVMGGRERAAEAHQKYWTIRALNESDGPSK